MYAELKPDVVVLDVKFGQAKTGFDAAKSILEADPNAKIVFWSQFDQDTVIKEAYRIGGHAYVTKVADPADLATAIGSASSGKLYFPPGISDRLATLSVRGDKSPQVVLDDREMQIFRLMAQGLTNHEISEKMGLATRTISNIRTDVMVKLGVQRPAEITLMAVRHGIIEA
jgi:two-component system invasion response regulator UvrY